MSSGSDNARNLRLHLGEHANSNPKPPAALRSRRVPPAPVRAAQRVQMKLGRLDWQQAWLEPLIAARRAALGDAAQGPPRFLVRVDEFPYYTTFDEPQQQGVEMSRRFHAVMAEEGVPHLMSILPQLTHAPLDPDSQGGRPLGDVELALIEQMRHDGVTFAQHGTTHRTRYANPRRRSELCGLSAADTEALLEEGRLRLLAAGIDARVFVPPFNRFDAAQYELLSTRFDVVCGGPESVALLGFHGGPLWRGDSVYLPCYAPLYADAKTVIGAAEQLIDAAPGTWVPIVLHTSWEQENGFAALRALARRIAPYAASWEQLLTEVDRSRNAEPAAPASEQA
ncbi:MAG: DUF2334 domain-containing protein [Solirubrobacteraceae bacterium]